MPRKAKPRAPNAPLAPVSSDVLDQFVGQGPCEAPGERTTNDAAL